MNLLSKDCESDKIVFQQPLKLSTGRQLNVGNRKNKFKAQVKGAERQPMLLAQVTLKFQLFA